MLDRSLMKIGKKQEEFKAVKNGQAKKINFLVQSGNWRLGV
jgi:hypothetical protein